MALIDLLQNRFVDHTLIGSVLPGEAVQSGGVFAYKSDTEVTLKTGKVIKTSLLPTEITAAISAARTQDAVPVAGSSSEELTNIVIELNTLVKELTKLNSHVHFISECIQRQTMGGN